MAGTAIFIIFLVVYLICSLLNRFVFREQWVNAGYIFLAICAALFLYQLQAMIRTGANAYVMGIVFGTWLVPCLIAWFIGRKFTRQNPRSFPSSLWSKAV